MFVKAFDDGNLDGAFKGSEKAFAGKELTTALSEG